MIKKSKYCSMATSGWDSRVKKMCCWAKLPSQPSYRKMHEVQAIKDLIQDLKKGIQNKICQPCWDMENVGAISMRQEKLQNKTPEIIIKEIQNKKIKHLIIDSGTQCNFACRTCGPWSSTGHYKEFETKTGRAWNDNKISYTPVDSILENDLSAVESIEILGGEPFTNLDHLRIINKINQLSTSLNCSLVYITNGSVKLKPEILENFNRFKTVNICLSIDAIGEPFNYIRTLGNWETILKNYETLKHYKSLYNNLNISAHPTVSALNIFYLKELFEWFIQEEIQFNVVFCTHPEEYSMQIFNEQQKEKLVSMLKNNLPIYKEQIISHIVNTDYNKEALSKFKEAITFTENFRKISLKNYLPKLYNFLF